MYSLRRSSRLRLLKKTKIETFSEEEDEIIIDEEKKSEEDEDEEYEYGDEVYIIAGKLQELNPTLNKEDILKSVNESLSSKARKRKYIEEENEYGFIVPDNVIDGVVYPDLDNVEYRGWSDETPSAEANVLLDEITKELLTYNRIMVSPILKKDKKRALKLFEILRTMAPDTLEYVHLEDEILKLISINKNICQDEVDQLHEIETKLRESNYCNTITNIKKSIFDLQTSDEVKGKLLKIYDDLLEISPNDSNYSILQNKLDWGLNLPYEKYLEPKIKLNMTGNIKFTPKEIKDNCIKIKKALDEELYGLEDVKERLIEVINNRYYNPKTKSMIALVSPPGRGKNAIVKALSKAIGIPYTSIPFGGMGDPSSIRGDRGVYVGAEPSIFLQILRKLGYSNGIAGLDEIDKLTGSRGRSVQDALLHILDYSQNDQFHDQFLSEYTHDVSQIWYILLMNDTKPLNPAFLDRLDIVYIRDYTSSESIEIIKRHFLPNSLANVGYEGNVTITDEACLYITNLLSYKMKEFGLRPVQRYIHNIASRLNGMRTYIADEHNEGKPSYYINNYDSNNYTITEYTLVNLSSKDTGYDINISMMYI